MQEISWGIIGCGDVTEVKSGPAFNKVNNSKLIAVMRRDAAKAQDYAQRHQVSKWYNNAQHLINDPDVNAIYIATPPVHHEAYAIAALQAGKAVYVEKPMALDSVGAKKIDEVSKHTGVKLSVAHYRRLLPLFKRVKEIIDNGLLGDIRLINLQLLQPHNSALITKTSDDWRINPQFSGGGLFHDLAPHQLDLMIYFFGKVTKATGLALNQGNYYHADDLVQGTLLFESNAVFNGVWSFTVPEEETKDYCEVIGVKGKISFSIFKHNKLVLHINKEHTEESFSVPQHVQQPMIEQVVRFFRGEADNPCTPKDGVEVMRLIDEFTKKF
jgi:predicted dehydrogenase